MDSVDIIFTRSNKIGSLIIRLFTWSDWSHCAVIDGDNVVESVMPDGVRVSSLSVLKASSSTWEIKTYPVKDSKVFVSYAKSQLGKKYDYLGAIGIAFRIKSEKKHRWFCSEFLAHCALQCGSSWFEDDSLHKITPQNIYQLNFAWLEIK